jgi:hypothetical protein
MRTNLIVRIWGVATVISLFGVYLFTATTTSQTFSRIVMAIGIFLNFFWIYQLVKKLLSKQKNDR